MKNDNNRSIDLKEVIKVITEWQPNVEKIYLFGSRAYDTGSYGSDIDLLLDTNGQQNPKLFMEVRKFEPYIDIFQIKGNFAESLGNQSQIRSPNITTKEELIKRINAIEIWNIKQGWVCDEKYQLQCVLLGCFPALSMAQSLGMDDPARQKCDILIITTVQEEFDAMRKTLKDMGESYPLNYHAIQGYIIERKSGKKIVALSKSSRIGTVAAALNTQRCISAISPRLVILVGITAGIQGEVNLGDIIIPDRIIDYESIKVDESGESSHGLIREPHTVCRQKISMWEEIHDWLRDFNKRVSSPINSDTKIYTDAMASGNKLITDPQFIKKIQAMGVRKIISIEMESIGVAEACDTNPEKIPYIVIKSVSDFADTTKKDDWHPFCCQIAAEFTMTLIKEEII